MDWLTYENEVRAVAESAWATPCIAETINGVRCDAVIKIKSDYWILIEISKSSTLDKLRTDLAKFAAMRPFLFSQQIYSECFFITTEQQDSLISTGHGLNVTVQTLPTFASKFAGSSQYISQRKKESFGSAVNPLTGAADRDPYTPIKYFDQSGTGFNISDVAEMVKSGRQVVMTGEFGTGKSRCIQEVFDILSDSLNTFPPLAINLRDHWGYQQFSPIVVAHLESLGLSAFSDPIIRSLRRGLHPLLLDGFDEIGSQSWSGEPDRLREIRLKSSEGVRQLISACKNAGLLITGREHYFNDSKEMQECLGLNDDHIVLNCPDEFTEDQAAQYIKARVGFDVTPEWMPKKPLVCQLLARLNADDIDNIQKNSNGEIEFFESVLDAICIRETRIRATVSSDVLKSILLKLANLTRMRKEGAEAITPNEINTAFYESAGYAPLDESAIMLQRLPYLGLIGSGSPDRQFIDQYAKDGLRGLGTKDAFLTHDEHVARQGWVQPLGDFGISVLQAKMPNPQQCHKYIKFSAAHGNNQVGCDYVAALNLSDSETINYNGILVTGGSIRYLNFSNSLSIGLTISNVFIDHITIEDASFSDVAIQNCAISLIDGIGSKTALPDIFGDDCIIEKLQPALTISRISELKLSNAHKTLLALLKKLFLQPGSGRQEEALLRGAEGYWDREAAEISLRYLETNRMILKTKGNHGIVYVPQRRFTKRVRAIVDMRSGAKDELWDRVVS